MYTVRARACVCVYMYDILIKERYSFALDCRRFSEGAPIDRI